MRAAEQHLREEHIAAALNQVVLGQVLPPLYLAEMADDGAGGHRKAGSGTVGNEGNPFSGDVVDGVAVAVGIFPFVAFIDGKEAVVEGVVQGAGSAGVDKEGFHRIVGFFGFNVALSAHKADLRGAAGQGFDGDGIVGGQALLHLFAGSLLKQAGIFLAGDVVILRRLIGIPDQGDGVGIAAAGSGGAGFRAGGSGLAAGIGGLGRAVCSGIAARQHGGKEGGGESGSEQFLNFHHNSPFT